MTINQDLTESMISKGFAIAKQVISKSQIEALRTEVDRIHAQYQSLKASESELRLLGEWSIKNPHLVSDAIRSYFLASNMTALVQAFFAEKTDFYWGCTANKPAETGRCFPWHQDAGYGSGPTAYITVWTALDEVDIHNGCLWVIPGSHRQGIFPHEVRYKNDRDYAGSFMVLPPADEANAEPVKLNSGDVVMMDAKTIHQSRQNHSAFKRRGLISAYLTHMQRQLIDHTVDEQPLSLG